MAVSGIQHGRIQGGCHHQVESEWISEVFCANGGEGSVSEVFLVANGGTQSNQVWVSLTGKTKMDESKMKEFKMGAIIKLSQNEWVKFFYANGGEWSVSEVFICANGGTNLSKCEWVWQEKLRWLNTTWQNSRWLPSSSWVRMNKWRLFCAKCLNPRWQNSRWLPSSS